MKNNFVLAVYLAVLVVIGCAAEEILPSVLGVRFPVLLAAVNAMAIRRETRPAMFFAIAAGGMEEAVSAMPMFTSLGFFVASSLAVRWLKPQFAPAIAAFPVYELWLAIWLPAGIGGFMLRSLVSLPIGAATFFATLAIISVVERKAAINETE